MQLISKKQKTNSAHDVSEYHHFRILRAVSLGIGGLLIVGVGIVLYFMYLNIFDTINRVHSIILLSNEYGGDVIDFPLYEQTKKNWDSKIEAQSQAPLPRNIFSGSVATTTPAIQPSQTPVQTVPKPVVPNSQSVNQSL